MASKKSKSVTLTRVLIAVGLVALIGVGIFFARQYRQEQELKAISQQLQNMNDSGGGHSLDDLDKVLAPYKDLTNTTPLLGVNDSSAVVPLDAKNCGCLTVILCQAAYNAGSATCHNNTTATDPSNPGLTNSAGANCDTTQSTWTKDNCSVTTSGGGYNTTSPLYTCLTQAVSTCRANNHCSGQGTCDNNDPVYQNCLNSVRDTCKANTTIPNASACASAAPNLSLCRGAYQAATGYKDLRNAITQTSISHYSQKTYASLCNNGQPFDTTQCAGGTCTDSNGATHTSQAGGFAGGYGACGK